MATDDEWVFDEDWVAQARHHELSADEMRRQRRADRRRERRVRRRRLLKRVVLVGVLVALGVGVALSPPTDRQSPSVGITFGHAGLMGSHALAGDFPTPTDGGPERLRPEVVSGMSGSFAFAQTRNDGSPVTHDPCRPVRFAVNPAGAPPGHRETIEGALAEVSVATGLVLELVGETDEPPTATEERAPYQPDRYGDQWAPVLVAWTDETVIPELAGSFAGLGGGAWIDRGDGRGWYVSGLLYLDTELGTDLERNRAVFLHELGHVLGLGHVDDANEIMNDEARTTELGPGDLEGLAAVGSGDCAGQL